MSSHRGSYNHEIGSTLCWAALCLCLSVSPAGAAASQDICTSRAIEFAPLESKHLFWWALNAQTSKLTEGGVAIADVELQYKDWSTDLSESFTTETVVIGDEEFKYRISDDAFNSINWSSSFPAVGFVIPRTINGNTVASLTIKANQFQIVIVDVRYASTRGTNSVFADLYCFLKSPTVAAGLK